MNDPIVEIYAEIEWRMLATAEEGKKTCSIDIEMMVAHLRHCLQLLDRATNMETDTVSLNALAQLHATVTGHIDLLTSKIRQLKVIRPHGGDLTSGNTDDGAKISTSKTDRQLAIKDTLMQGTSVRFGDVAGLHEAKQALREAIIMPLQYPQLFTGGRQPWKRILLYGPPGTGKSYLARAISGEIQSCFYSVSSADLVSSWVGESEKLIKELFHQATTHLERSVIFIDEIDSICRQRTAREEEYTRRIKTELLRQMEGVDNGQHADKIFLLCATNCPWELDPAFLRRFQRRIYIPLPDRSARLDLLKLHARDQAVAMGDQDWDVLADKTAGYSGSDIAGMVLGALFEPVRQLQSSTHWIASPNGRLRPCDSECVGATVASLSQLPPHKIQASDVRLADFIKSLHSHKQTVSEAELMKFDSFTKNFGQHG